MINLQAMLDEFLNRLSLETTEDLLADIERAREDSKDSYLLDEDEE